jgi:hypothetical protein
MNLQSYPKFAKHEAKIKKQLDRLKDKVLKNDTDVEDLTKSYVTAFADGLDTSAISEKLGVLKSKSEALKHEMDIVNNHDFKEKELAHEVYQQYLELEREVNAEASRLHDQAEKVKDEAEAAIKRVNEQLDTLHVQLGQVSRDQFLPIIEHLGVSENVKSNLRLKTESVMAYSSVRNIQRQ